MKMAHRIKHMKPDPTGHYFATTKVVNGNPVWTGNLNLAPDHILSKPLSWKKPRRIFVNSMSDLFHESVPDEWIDKVFAIMALCPQHTFQVLTKRSKRMREYFKGHSCLGDTVNRLAYAAHAMGLNDDCLNVFSNILYMEPNPKSLICKWPLPNVHLGVSCEDQQRADERIPDLLETPAAVRFVSAEPLLGPNDLERIWGEILNGLLAQKTQVKP